MITTASTKPLLPIDGVHIEVPAAKYHSWPACSATAMRRLNTATAEHLHWDTTHPLESPAMRVGSALHCLVLEPTHYEERYISAPECDRRTTVGKNTYAEFVAAAGDRVVLTADEAERVAGMAHAITRHHGAYHLLQACTSREVSCLASINACPVKCRVDAASTDWRTVVDVKTTSGLASRVEFERAIANYGYGIQAAHYRETVRAATLREVAATHIAFIVVESAPPHCVAVYRLDDAVIGLFAQRLPELRRRWRDVACIGAGRRDLGWPQTVQEIGVPPWLRRQLEEEVCDE